MVVHTINDVNLRFYINIGDICVYFFLKQQVALKQGKRAIKALKTRTQKLHRGRITTPVNPGTGSTERTPILKLEKGSRLDVICSNMGIKSFVPEDDFVPALPDHPIIRLVNYISDGIYPVVAIPVVGSHGSNGLASTLANHHSVPPCVDLSFHLVGLHTLQEEVLSGLCVGITKRAVRVIQNNPSFLEVSFCRQSVQM